LTNKFVGLRRTVFTTPNLAVRISANGLIGTAIALGKTKPFIHAAGSLGLAGRGTILVTQPLWNPPAQF
jgi:hypothetical protein